MKGGKDVASLLILALFVVKKSKVELTKSRWYNILVTSLKGSASQLFLRKMNKNEFEMT